jgi:predicted flap endonuclease-1-like 5' DNA nuclease
VSNPPKGETMSFQAYLDNVEEKTGKTPNDFLAEAKQKNITQHKDIIAWLKKDYGLGLGHARAVAHVIQHGPDFEVRQATGPHRDVSGTLKLDGKPKKKSESDLPSLAAPAQRALAGAGIKSLQQLTKWTEADLKNLHGMGPNAIGKLRQALTEQGLSFKNKI